MYTRYRLINGSTRPLWYKSPKNLCIIFLITFIIISLAKQYYYTQTHHVNITIQEFADPNSITNDKHLSIMYDYNSIVHQKELNYNIHTNKPMVINALGIDSFFDSVHSKSLCVSVPDPEMKIIDVVLIHSEMEVRLLELRFFELNEFVDKFIVVEIMYFANGEKRENTMFDKFMYQNKFFRKYLQEGKLKHIVVDDNIFEGASDSYWDSIARTELVKIARKNGGLCDNNKNMMILSDTDEIPRSSVFEVLKKCPKLAENTPISLERREHFYDFGCTDYQWLDNKVKVLKCADISTKRGKPNDYHNLRDSHSVTKRQMKTDRNGVIFKFGSWHLSYFGAGIQDIIFKNMKHQHSKSRNKWNLDPFYIQCLINTCGYPRDSEQTRRIPFIDKNDKYYPLFIQKGAYKDSEFWKENVDDKPAKLYQKYLTFYLHSSPNLKPEQFCYELYRKSN